MMFSDLRDLDATAPLVTTDAVDAINFVFFCCVNVAFAAGVCVVVTSTVFTVQMRRIVTPAAVSKYLQNARPWTRIAADLFALQVRICYASNSCLLMHKDFIRFQSCRKHATLLGFLASLCAVIYVAWWSCFHGNHEAI